ncbi:MAG: hypothetical protein ACKOAT_08365 [Actinomycetota bacterium]
MSSNTLTRDHTAADVAMPTISVTMYGTNDRRKITKDDLEQRFKALQDDVTEITETRKMSITVLAVAGVAAGLLVAYLLGRRGGRRRRGVIEIRR